MSYWRKVKLASIVMRNFKFLIILAIILTSIISYIFYKQSTPIITDYHQTFIPIYNKNEKLKIAIRMYYVKSTPYFLLVDPYTLKTETSKSKDFKYRKAILSNENDTNNRYFHMKTLLKTPYMKALNKYSSPPYKLQNYGIIKSTNKTLNGVFLTIDMCPSLKPFEKNFFETLVNISNQNNITVPIAISITGSWLINHEKDFAWLIKQQKSKKLQITWINHSFSHVYYYDLPFKENFLLTPETNFEYEILANEKILLEHKQLPSPFFRFPGLVSNKDLITKLKKLGLITVGSNAWLAKGEKIKKGSFILVHGNSNGPEGIQKIMPILKNSKLKILPLQKAIITE